MNRENLIKKSNDKNSALQQKNITRQGDKKYSHPNNAKPKIKIDATINRRNTRQPLTN
ncbi:hypothetical protein ACF3OJ_06025 [Cardiobacterium hominis]|uniref:hypothetical protein n=1 Tax=Cardiobacterium hominis TaxID=2718 RepID=UPI00370DBB88